jgi:L,D-transpeptidase catalytic domain
MLRRTEALLFVFSVAACATPALPPLVPAPPRRAEVPPPPPAAPEPLPPTAPEPTPPALAADPPPAPRLTSQGYVTWIYARPRADTHFVGYVRNGSSIALRSTEPVRGEGCPGGFYLVEPRGFVCNDRTVTRSPSARAVETAAAAAGAPGPFPYRYAFADGAPMYNRIPDTAEQHRVERAYGPAGDERRPPAHASAYQDLASLATIAAVDAVPPFLADGGAAAEDRFGLVKDTLPAGAIVSFTRAFAAEGRTWLLAADQTLVPADRVRVFRPSSFHGVQLGGETTLPLAWMRGAARPQYRRVPSGTLEKTGGEWPVRTYARLGAAVVEQDGTRFLETLERDAEGATLFVAEKDATVATAATALATGVKPGQKWITVSITQGTLVAYEGLTPVYATLMSPGRGGVPVPGRDNVADSTTPTGTYSITFKDRAATMSPDKPGGPRTHFIADVPHVQYFKAPFALHAAYWHERFGEPTSAGCINVSPIDAEALFGWTDPPVPAEWQGATGAGAPSNGKTTAVVVRR